MGFGSDVTVDNVHQAFLMVTWLNLTARICCRPEVADKEPCVVIYSYNPWDKVKAHKSSRACQHWAEDGILQSHNTPPSPPPAQSKRSSVSLNQNVRQSDWFNGVKIHWRQLQLQFYESCASKASRNSSGPSCACLLVALFHSSETCPKIGFLALKETKFTKTCRLSAPVSCDQEWQWRYSAMRKAGRSLIWHPAAPLRTDHSVRSISLGGKTQSLTY